MLSEKYTRCTGQIYLKDMLRMVGRMFAGTTHKKCHHCLYHHHQDDDVYVENGCWWVGRMWDWAPNPPLPKRLTAAPVRIKPVPRSLLSIHSAIVDLQFGFSHWHICFLCLYVFACFPDQTNKIPLSLFAPFRWTKIVWEVFFSYNFWNFSTNCYYSLNLKSWSF